MCRFGASAGPKLRKTISANRSDAAGKRGEQKMPLYEYHCRKCGKIFEMLRRIKDADSDLECPNCHTRKVERQLSRFASGGCGASRRRGFT
jgi:putative FmdB family regulatory protein